MLHGRPTSVHGGTIRASEKQVETKKHAEVLQFRTNGFKIGATNRKVGGSFSFCLEDYPSQFWFDFRIMFWMVPGSFCVLFFNDLFACLQVSFSN